MPDSVYRIEALLGMNRNSAEGESEQNPIDLNNLIPTRGGGWQIRGFARTLNAGVAYPTRTLFDNTNGLVGYDHQGYASFTRQDSGSDYHHLLIRPPGMTITEGPSKLFGRVAESVHIPGVGVYGEGVNSGPTDDTGGFLFVNQNSTVISGKANSTPTVTAGTGGTLPSGNYRAYTLSYISTAGGKLLVGADMWYRTVASTGKLTITMPASPPDGLGVEVYLARDPVANTFNASSGAISRPLEYVLQGVVNSGTTSLTVDEVQFGPTINLNGNGFPLVASLFRPDPSLVGLHNGRIYFNPSENEGSYTYRYAFPSETTPVNYGYGNSWRSALDAYTPFTVSWTERGYVNLFNPVKAWYNLPAANSQQITAFVSTQEGQLVFCDNECFMMRGDPSYAEEGRWEDFNFLPYMAIGCDKGVSPGRLGPEVYTIWKGEVYQVTNGQAENVSRPVYDRQDKFVQVVGDVEQNAIICRSAFGACYAYYPALSHWTRIYNNIRLLLPTSTQVYAIPNTGSGLQYLSRAENEPTLTTSTSFDTPSAVYETSLGEKHRRKMLKRIRIPVSDSYRGTIPVVEIQVDTTFGVRSTTFALVGYKVGDDYIFAAPLGLTGYRFRINVTFPAMRAGDVVEGPIDIEYVDRGQKR